LVWRARSVPIHSLAGTGSFEYGGDGSRSEDRINTDPIFVVVVEVSVFLLVALEHLELACTSIDGANKQLQISPRPSHTLFDTLIDVPAWMDLPDTIFYHFLQPISPIVEERVPVPIVRIEFCIDFDPKSGFSGRSEQA
jgi:hypothetical protein